MNSTRLLLLAIVACLSLIGCGSEERAAANTMASGEASAHADGDSDKGSEHGEEGHGDGEHADEGGHIELTAEQISTAGIGIGEAGAATIRQHLPLYGVIAPNAERVREVAARFPGVIRTVNRSIGDTVNQGETLATVESNESLQTYAVAAPLAGVVTARNANPGEQTGDKSLFTVADLSSVWVEISLFPRDVAKVRVGQSVRVRASEAQVTGEGKVVCVAPFGSSSNQTLTARVLLDNKDRKWPPGLYVTAEVTLAVSQVSLAVATTALQTLEEDTVVFVQNAEGFEPRVVQVGRSDGEYTEITAGLKAGERYATNNSFILKAELGKGEAEHEH